MLRYGIPHEAALLFGIHCLLRALARLRCWSGTLPLTQRPRPAFSVNAKTPRSQEAKGESKVAGSKRLAGNWFGIADPCRPEPIRAASRMMHLGVAGDIRENSRNAVVRRQRVAPSQSSDRGVAETIAPVAVVRQVVATGAAGTRHCGGCGRCKENYPIGGTLADVYNWIRL